VDQADLTADEKDQARAHLQKHADEVLGSEDSTDTTTAAAVAAPVQTAAPAAPITENRMDPKTIARDLGLPEDATENQIRSAASAAFTGLSGLLTALGVTTVDAARGAIEAGKTAAAELVKSQARTKDLEAEKEATERAGIIAKLEVEKRLTPAQRDGFAKTANLETLREFAKTAPVIAAESQHHEAQAGASSAAAAAPVKHDGKSYEDLTGPERIALRSSDKDTFNLLRNDWIARGQPLAKTTAA
jgi:hypothetical protein